MLGHKKEISIFYIGYLVNKISTFIRGNAFLTEESYRIDSKGSIKEENYISDDIDNLKQWAIALGTEELTEGLRQEIITHLYKYKYINSIDILLNDFYIK
ncbi:hypothetical protein [Cognatishimia sp.]|uniref:hypothetical protein n=1 Tax=Cognatishimia sp. TaxID=2211648 RepID=UPI0035132B1F|nr:hypothetical protein [Legionellales bacterium]NQY58420.1 hypothetical protein [Cognatishimia sp.]